MRNVFEFGATLLVGGLIGLILAFSVIGVNQEESIKRGYIILQGDKFRIERVE